MDKCKSQVPTQFKKSNSKFSKATLGTSNDYLPIQEDQETPEFYFAILEVIKNLSPDERNQIKRINLLDSLDKISKIQQMFPNKQYLLKDYLDKMFKLLKTTEQKENRKREASKIIEIKRSNEES